MADFTHTPEPTYLWGRSVAWRQGSFLSSSDAVRLGLITNDENQLVVVISHDCDCVNDEIKEPFLEVMVGEIIPKASGNYTHAKNTRILHLSFEDSGTERNTQLNILDKKNVRKTDLIGISPDPIRSLIEEERRTLSSWLAARYQRAAFPEEFNRRFREVEGILKRVAEKSRAVQGIYIDFEPHSEIQDDAEPYEVSIFVVYFSDVEGAEEAAWQTSMQITEGFEKTFKTLDTAAGLQWRLIDLRSCEPASDIQFTLRDVMTFYQYRLEHISLKQRPQTPTT